MARLFTAASSDYCYQNTASSATSTTITIAAWIYEATRLSGGGNPANAHVLWSLNANTVFNEISSDNGTLNIAFNNFGWNNTAQTLPLTTWTHVATWCDATNFKVFLNGAQVYSVAGTGAAVRTFPSVIGGWANTSGNVATTGFFDGRITDYATWNVALRTNEIAALANGMRPFQIRPKNMQTFLPLDGLSSPEPDYSGSPTNGTLSGTAFAPGPPVTMFTPKPFNYVPLIGPPATLFARSSL